MYAKTPQFARYQLGLNIVCIPKISVVDMFNTILHSEMMTCGLFLKELGTDSSRKRAAMCAHSKCGGPSTVNMYHRASCSISNVHQRYIIATEGGNQMVGLILCGGE